MLRKTFKVGMCVSLSAQSRSKLQKVLFIVAHAMGKRKFKFSLDEIEGEVLHFIQVTKSSDDASDYLLSQLVYVVSELPKTKQVEFLNGLINAKQELV